MALPALAPPPFRARWTTENGLLTADAQRWLQELHRFLAALTGSSLPQGAVVVAAGGTGATNAAAAAAAVAAGTDAVTQTKSVTLDTPDPELVTDYADTVVTWDTPFADAIYTATVAFINSSAEVYATLTVTAKTAADITVRVTSLGALDTSALSPTAAAAAIARIEGYMANVQCTGVHA